MRRRMGVLLAAAGMVAALAVPAVGLVGGETNATSMVATLTGGGEVPAVSTRMAGIARVTIDLDKRLICYDLSVTGKRTPAAVHIHEGAADANGPIVIDFGAFGQKIARNSKGCTRQFAKSVLSPIVANPTGYYVNVHTPANPGGEVRGQLATD